MTESKAKSTTTTAAKTKAASTKKATEAKAAEKEVEEVAEKKKEITLDTRVEVFNNTTGKLIYSAKKGNGYLHLDSFMDSDVMTVEELQVLKNTARKFLTNGWLYIDDEDVLEYLRLGSIKDSVKNPQLLEDAVDNGKTDEVLELFDKMGKSSKEVMYGIIKKRYEDKEFSNAHIIKEIEDKLGVANEDSLLQN